MERVITSKLIQWKNKKSHNPLIINGARHVGKTYLIEEFGKTYFKKMIKIDFSGSDPLTTIFNDNINADYLLNKIEVLSDTKIIPGGTLLFFDEIQDSPRALNSLKYFNEQAPEYHIICAGTLIGVNLNSKTHLFL
jgi:predicted AAA+ superfamily ATPase